MQKEEQTMNREEVIEELDKLLGTGKKRPEAEIEVVTAPVEPVAEDTRTSWEKQGYLEDIALVAQGFEESREQFLLPARVRTIIETVNNAKIVSDFDRYTNEEIQDLIDSMRHEVPQIESRVRDFIGKIERAQTAVVDVDFI